MEKLFHNIPSALMNPDDLRECEQQVYEDFINTGQLHMKGRFLHKNGEELWIHIEGRMLDEEIFCIITDETEIKRMLLELKAEKQFNNTITSFTNDIFFYFDLRDSSICFSGIHAQEYFPNLTYESFPRYMMDNTIGFKEELHNFVSMIEAMNSGKEIITEFRFKNRKEKESWFRVEYRIVFDNKIPVYAIGKLTNIDIEKHVIIRAETDCLRVFTTKELLSSK